MHPAAKHEWKKVGCHGKVHPRNRTTPIMRIHYKFILPLSHRSTVSGAITLTRGTFFLGRLLGLRPRRLCTQKWVAFWYLFQLIFPTIFFTLYFSCFLSRFIHFGERAYYNTQTSQTSSKQFHCVDEKDRRGTHTSKKQDCMAIEEFYTTRKQYVHPGQQHFHSILCNDRHGI